MSTLTIQSESGPVRVCAGIECSRGLADVRVKIRALTEAAKAAPDQRAAGQLVEQRVRLAAQERRLASTEGR